MLEVFDNDSIRRVLHVSGTDRVPSVELRRRICLASIPELLVQRRLSSFCHVPDGELIKKYFCTHHLTRDTGELEAN